MTLWIAAGAAVLAAAAVAALVMSRLRVGAIAPFAVAGLMLGVAALAAGGGQAGVALIGVTAILSLMAYATGALVGDPAAPRRAALPRMALATTVVTLGVLIATTLFAPPPLRIAALATPAPAFDLARGLDLFLALAALIGVAGAAAALLGFGERGVLGAPREGPR